MTRKRVLRTTTAFICALGLLGGPVARAADPLTPEQKIALLRQKVKYVFVIFHENRAFDHYFGTFPGANGLFSAPDGQVPANKTASWSQKYLDPQLHTVTVSPFLIPQTMKDKNGNTVQIYPADTGTVGHSHQQIASAMHFDASSGRSLNDRYAMTQQGLTTDDAGTIIKSDGTKPTEITLAQKQQAMLDIGHVDCDTIPFMWQWAKNFVLFDAFSQTIIGPSTPNAIAIIAGQTGETQWAEHNEQGPNTGYAGTPGLPLGAVYTAKSGGTNNFVPVIADPGPFPGSNADPSAAKPPYNFDSNPANPTPNLTFASQPLSFMGSDIQTIIKSDQNPEADLADVQRDIPAIASNDKTVNWGWYQQGFNAADASDPYVKQGTGTPNPSNDPGLYTGYVLHHNAPEYFGYLADNTAVLKSNLHGAKDFFDAVENRTLPAEGGVFYLRGGYNNNDGLVPLDPTPGVQHAFLGNDDHPAYSDAQISEAFAARAIAAIANSPYWSQSAIIVTYDETDGLYDHVEPQVRSHLADNTPLAGGPRIPALLISPYAAQGKISHQYSEHGSIIKLINNLFGLVPLALLPDEKDGRAKGAATLGQPNLGPSDDPSNNLGDMSEAFDDDILQGNKPPLTPALATFTPEQIRSLPHLGAHACAAIGVLPTDYPNQAAYESGAPLDPAPVDFNPRPTQSPGTPTNGDWTP